MVTPLLGRPAESWAINDFLDLASAQPAALLVEGEAGIGKTTVWLAGLDSALERGFQVLEARPAAAKSVLAYTAVADMLSGVDTDVGGGHTGASAAGVGQGVVACQCG